MSLTLIRNGATAAGLTLVLALGLLFAPTVQAASDRQECEGSGGTYEKVQGTSTCTTVNEPPNQPNPGGVKKTDEESQKGSFKSSHPKDEENCVNNNGGSHCK